MATLRTVVLLFCCFVVLPFAVFLRPVHADEPRLYVLTHCGTAVFYIGDYKGMTYMGTPLGIAQNQEVAKVMTYLLKTASISNIPVEKISGIACPLGA